MLMRFCRARSNKLGACRTPVLDDTVNSIVCFIDGKCVMFVPSIRFAVKAPKRDYCSTMMDKAGCLVRRKVTRPKGVNLRKRD